MPTKATPAHCREQDDHHRRIWVNIGEGGTTAGKARNCTLVGEFGMRRKFLAVNRTDWIVIDSDSLAWDSAAATTPTGQTEIAHRPPWPRTAPPSARTAEPSRWARRHRRRPPPWTTASTRRLRAAPRREATIWPPWDTPLVLQLVVSPDAAAGGRRRRRGQNGKCRGASARKGYCSSG